MRLLVSFCSIALVACSGGSDSTDPSPSGPCGPEQVQIADPIANGTVLDSGSLGGNLVVDATYAYWVSEGELRAVPLDGTSPQVLAAGTFESAIAADDSAIYAGALAMDASIDIVRVPKDRGAATTLVKAPQAVAALAADADSVFWADGFAIYRVAKVGGPANLVVEATAAARLAVDDANLYWTSLRDPAHKVDGGIFEVSKAGGAPTKLVSSDAPMDLIPVGDSLYWSGYAGMGPLAGIHRVDAGGTDHALVSWGLARDIAVDATHLYWTTDGGWVYRVPLGGGGGEQVSAANLTTKEVDSLAIQLDANNVYFLAMVPGEYTTWLLQAPKTVAQSFHCVTPL